MQDVHRFLSTALEFFTDEYGVIFSSMLIMLTLGLLFGFIAFRVMRVHVLSRLVTVLSLLSLIPLTMLIMWVYDVSGLSGRAVATAFFSIAFFVTGGYLMLTEKTTIQKTRN